MDMTDFNHHCSILVVDDTESDIDILVETLSEYCDVRVATNGESALQAIDESLPDLILLDVIMPGLTGYEVCAVLKRRPDTKDIPVLFLTVLDETVDKVHGFSVGGLDYITKPFQMEEVIARVQAHLEAHRLRMAVERQNRELAENYERLRELEEWKDSLTHMIVHDLRSPLAAIKGCIEIIRGDVANLVDEDTREFLNVTIAGAETMEALIAQILDVGRLEAGEMPVTCRPEALKPLIQSVIESTAAAYGTRTIQLVCPDSVVCSCDVPLFERILRNLLTNAANFSPDNGAIEVRVTPQAGTARIAVLDSGPGVPEHAHERIFEKFHQVTSESDEERRGTGLGLAFCKLAVEAHHGAIGVQNRPEGGAEFWFTLPDHW